MSDDERSGTTGMGHRSGEDDDAVPGRDEPTTPSAAPAAAHDMEADLGSALRAIYTRTIDEAIPQEMLDLLKRLD